MTGATASPHAPSSSQSVHKKDRDCGDFTNQAAAQRYFLSIGGPASDPDRLDADHDGIACESLPCPCDYSTTAPTPTPTPTVTPTPTPTPEPASVSINFEDGVLYSGCLDYPYSFTLDLPSGTSSWSLDLVITKDGGQIASDAVFGTTPPTATVQSEVAICGSASAGELTATVVITGDGVELTQNTAFTMRRPSSQTTARIAGTPTCGKSVRIRSTTLEERPTGLQPASADVVLQQQLGSRWTVVADDVTDIQGAGTFAFPWRKPKRGSCSEATLRVMTAYDPDYREASYSKPMKLG